MFAIVGGCRPCFIATPCHFIRLLSASADKALLSKLRRTTGFTFSACKEALIRHNNDFDKAIAWLNEEAVRRGWDKAGKVSNRALSQGLLGVLQHRSNAVVIEVNCETDFVARNEQFQTFVANLTETVMNEFKSPTPAWRERAARLGKQLCQHIVGMNPRPGLEITEPNANPEEEQCLLLQPFFLDENIRVGEHLMRNDMILEDFIRIECGQDDSTVTCGAESPNENITSEN
ncbi:elongation factor Ts [Paragonimus westermani]|uniref:Elongation factor Ts, mitochondrial n=1 Tax=Paragonimus westermani TaxID=34504 RepID=A0A5J4NX71_9TREM|nr:elongation factor Ts [Paragonimus westermani]